MDVLCRVTLKKVTPDIITDATAWTWKIQIRNRSVLLSGFVETEIFYKAGRRRALHNELHHGKLRFSVFLARPIQIQDFFRHSCLFPSTM